MATIISPRIPTMPEISKTTEYQRRMRYFRDISSKAHKSAEEANKLIDKIGDMGEQLASKLAKANEP